MALVLPGRKYIGPGNPVLNGKPKSDADWVALEHDLAYGLVTNRKQVQSADAKAINKFWNAGGWDGYIGAVGLSLKNAFESSLGISVYPSEWELKARRDKKEISDTELNIELQKRKENAVETFRNENKNTQSNNNVRVSKMSSDTQSDEEFRDWRTRLTKAGRPWNRGNLQYAKAQRNLAKRRRLSVVSTATGRDTPDPDLPGTSGQARQQVQPETQIEATSSDDDEQVSDSQEETIQETQIMSSMDVDEPSTVTAGGGRGPGGGAIVTGGHEPMIITFPRQPSLKYKLTFRKTWVLNTWANAYKNIEFKVKEGLKPAKAKMVMTPLACLPVESLPLYMSISEFLSIHGTARATNYGIRVTPIGYRSSFTTGVSESNFANSNHSIFGICSVGLNLKTYCVHKQITSRNESHKMIVTDVENCTHSKLADRLYGSNSDEIPVIHGPHRTVPYYYCSVRDNMMPYQNLRLHCTEFEFLQHLNKPIIEHGGKFKNGFIKIMEGHYPNEADEGHANRTIGTYNLRSTVNNTQLSFAIGQNATVSSTKYLTRSETLSNTNNFNDDYEQCIEKPGLYNLTLSKTEVMKPHGNVYFGVQPIQSNIPDANDDYTNCNGIFKIDTFLDVEVNMQPHFSGLRRHYLRKGGKYGTYSKYVKQLNKYSVVDLYNI